MNSPRLPDHEQRLPPGVAARAASLLPSPPASSPPATVAAPDTPRAIASPDTPAPKARRHRVIAKRYRVDELLGEGGMAVVYRGWHLPLDEPIAIKILKQEYAENEEAVTRFLQEARAGALLRGKSVAQVLDIGRLESGPPFMVTELLSGRDLQEVLEASGRLPIDTALHLVKDVCSAVAEIHEVGIVHRDLKPANIFLSRDPDGGPVIKLLDFGIAKRLDGRDLNDTKNSLGSPHYMAPEQIVSAKEVDVQADIWSLGIVLFELLTGRVPFDADTVPAQCAQVLNAPCPDPSEFAPEVSPELRAVVLRCLEKEPDARYSSACELREALERCEQQQHSKATESELVVPITVCLPSEQLAPEPVEPVVVPERASAAAQPRRSTRWVAWTTAACACILALSFEPTRDAALRAYDATEQAAQRTYASAANALGPRWKRWFAPQSAAPAPARKVVVSQARIPPTPRVDPALPEVEPVLPEPIPKPASPTKLPRKALHSPAGAPAPRQLATLPLAQHPDTAIEQRYALTPTEHTTPRTDLINPYPNTPLK